jgi:hypothetical protein
MSVSLSLPFDSDRSLDNPVPAHHRMTQLADDDSTEEQFIKDFVGADYHNDGHSHLDALCHVSYWASCSPARRLRRRPKPVQRSGTSPRSVTGSSAAASCSTYLGCTRFCGPSQVIR